MILDVLSGASWMRTKIRRAPVTPRFARDVVDVVLTGVRS